MKKYKLLNTITILLGLLSFVMIIALGWFTYENYDRERTLMENNLLQEAEFIRTSLRAKLLMGIGGDLHQLRDYVERLETSPFVKHILVFDKDKNNLLGDEKYTYTEYPDNHNEHQKVNFDSEGNYVFTFISELTIHYDILTGKKVEKSDQGIKYTTVIELYANEYYEAQREDIRRALGTGLLLLVIGLASVYFIFVIRRYYSVNVHLQNVQDYISNVIQSMPNGLISLDKTGKVETVNRTAVKLLGLEENKVVGKNIHDVLPNCKSEALGQNNSEKFEQNVECHLNDGNTIPLNIISSKIKNEIGEDLGTVLIFTDLRELKSLEKAVERSERLASMGRMAAGIAHEIRNPLSSIKGLAQYLRNKFEKDSEDHEYASVMISEVDRLNRVIRDMLNFAKPHEPKLALCNIEDIVSHSLKLTESELNEKKINIILMNKDDLPTVLADSDLLTQVFLNLFANSIEAMDENGTIEISFSEEEQFVIIEISDEGSGIEEENLNKIFDPFFTSKSTGTGLGLAIVYRIIENHNGKITVNSVVNKGTTFIIKLPKSN
ncbi:Sensor protein of zinc sigma-54-dependent two-component system [hydrothermal vent metagenome]|uniref:histidine kinase n=1 Tax=hydrothermal vent metagenome TaxID=652676 RepID=A0A3B1CNI8_9ZZZZ